MMASFFFPVQLAAPLNARNNFIFLALLLMDGPEQRGREALAVICVPAVALPVTRGQQRTSVLAGSLYKLRTGVGPLPGFERKLLLLSLWKRAFKHV